MDDHVVALNSYETYALGQLVASADADAHVGDGLTSEMKECILCNQSVVSCTIYLDSDGLRLSISGFVICEMISLRDKEKRGKRIVYQA